MTTLNSKYTSLPSQKFLHAEEIWNLKQLYIDLTAAKQFYRNSERQKLSKTEETILRGLLCGQSPAEIAIELNRDCRGLRVDLSRGLYRYIEILTQKPLRDWKDVSIILKSTGYQISTTLDEQEISTSETINTSQNAIKSPQPKPLLTVVSTTPLVPAKPIKTDRIEAPDVSTFYGRETELATLQQWIIEDHCRVVAISGIQGVGKTALASKFIREMEGDFEYIIWRNLDHAPSFTHLITDFIYFFSKFSNLEKYDEYLINQFVNTLVKSEISTPDSIQYFAIYDGIRTLIQFLEKHRCLIVLDHWESLFQPNTLVGHYQAGYQAYGELLDKMGQYLHQSCLLLTSCEIPKAIPTLSSKNKVFRCLKLQGLTNTDAENILQNEGIFAETETLNKLVSIYNGNPLALQSIGKIIQNIFVGNTVEFFNYLPLLGDLDEYLCNQFNRLSPTEKIVLCKMASFDDNITLPRLATQFPTYNSSELIQTLESLEKRSLILMQIQEDKNQCKIDPLIHHYLHNHCLAVL